MSYTVKAGGTVPLDPADKRVIQFNFDHTNTLAADVEISTATITIEAIRQSGETALTSDNTSIVTGNRKVNTRLLATTATLGDEYWVTCQIVTNESPAQTINQRIRVVIADQ